MWKQRTRIKLVYAALGLALAEGLLKVLLPEFPLTEVFALNTLVVGTYLGVRTVNNIRGYGNNDTYSD